MCRDFSASNEHRSHSCCAFDESHVRRVFRKPVTSHHQTPDTHPPPARQQGSKEARRQGLPSQQEIAHLSGSPKPWTSAVYPMFSRKRGSKLENNSDAKLDASNGWGSIFSSHLLWWGLLPQWLSSCSLRTMCTPFLSLFPVIDFVALLQQLRKASVASSCLLKMQHRSESFQRSSVSPEHRGTR